MQKSNTALLAVNIETSQKLFSISVVYSKKFMVTGKY